MQKSSRDSKTTAIQTLQKIKQDLQQRGYAYTSLGYRGGPLNQGHALPLRIDYLASKKQITVHFLNLGEGVSLNPELAWSGNYPRRHFRSFPITFSEEVFFGDQGVDLFSRQMTLMNASASGNVPGYSTDDVIGAFCAVGTANGYLWNNHLPCRSNKPQTTPTCADEAVKLLIRDFLIEKGIAKKEIQRLFCNEKLCSVLCFSHTLSPSSQRDDWILFKKALQEFAITVVKKVTRRLKPRKWCFVKRLSIFS